MLLDAWALARALRRGSRPPASIALLGGDVRLALRMARLLPRPADGGSLFLVQVANEAARNHAARFAARGWAVRGLGLAPEDWLADPAGARVDAIVAWRVLGELGEAQRRALLDRVPRHASRFVALEAGGAMAEGAFTALWPAWHSCVIRERPGWRVQLFEAASL